MKSYPGSLKPNASERIKLKSRIVELPKTVVKFGRWLGKRPKESYGNKPLLDLRGECVFAELAILREFQAAGWDGRWIDSYSRKYRIGYWGDGVFQAIPRKQSELLDAIGRKTKRYGGCFDVVCWNNGDICFAEAKWQGKDRFRDSQRNWLDAALHVGLRPEQFLIVEWSFH